ncbi:hypothetical protein E0E52_07745 [Azotobacter chroococcum]|uniref:hypothetical protein n=1 Tax=Azotobacter chroococcum TaxID=353 RepID=UPI00103BAF34|nr:hypothetical protein [Azotobacter chroococcum]TBW09311.1 hypothetical protein E0E52_07745 [Azotobacter chroococcum]
MKEMLVKNLLANSVNQVITIATLLVLTPLFLHYWGDQRYGAWLVMVSIPLLLAYADFGSGPVFANHLSLKMEDPSENPEEIFWTGLATQIAFCLLTTSAFLAFMFSHREATGNTQLTVSICMTTYAVLGVLATYITGCSRAIGENHNYTNIGTAIRGTEIIVTALALNLGGDEQTLATSLMANRAIGTALIFLKIKTNKQIFKTGKPKANLGLAKHLIPDSMSFALYPLSLALMLQIPINIINSNFGPVAVALYATTRTLARVPVQFSNIISSSLWPILTKIIGVKEDLHGGAKIIQQANLAIIVFIIIFIPSGLLLGNYIFNLWTAGALKFSPELFAALGIQAGISAVWMNSIMKTISTNSHTRTCLTLSIITILTLSICDAIASEGMTSIIMTLIAGEILMLIAAQYRPLDRKKS